MPLTRLCIKNFKSIKSCDISFSELNVLIGENGTGKTNILDAINYFYRNLTESNTSDRIFDENNHYSNELRITLVYDLSEFVKISKSNSDELPNLFDDQLTEKAKYGGYYKAIISMASKSKDKQLYVELSQIKGYPIRWNYSYEDRLIFKSLFPIFYIDTRNLDVTEWGYMWDVLGELGKVSNAERKTIESKIHETLLDDNQEMSRKLKVITDIFSAADVSVKPAMSREFAQNLTKVFFSGEVIRQRGKWLGYYSTGTNSVKYIELLIKSIDAISKTKMKEPIVLFDEPEISLHSSYLDELTGAMLDVNSRLRIVVATHSSRLTKNIVTGAEKVSLYNVKLTNKYSNIQRMKKFPQYSPSSKYRVSDDHINSYFSRGILFVEGETELELFSNPYIKILFPKLKEIDVFKAMSDEPILNIMNPKLVNTHTPYMCLIDMDKAIRYDKERKKLFLKNEYFPSNVKERFQYRNKHESNEYLYAQRKRINAMSDKLHIHYYMPFQSCDDPNYHVFISAVQQYLLAYNVFSFITTIEGALISKNAVDFSLEFLQKKKSERAFNEFKEYWDGLQRTDQSNVLRIVFNGKSDLLKTWKEVSKKLDPDKKLILERVMIGGKTSGWVSEYLDAFFESLAPTDGVFSGKAFRKYLEKDENVTSAKKEFEHFFPELHSLIGRLCDMIS